MQIVLAPEGPLDVDATLARYRLWGEDPANRLGDGVFRRVLRAGARLVPYEVRWSGPVDATRLAVCALGPHDASDADAIQREVHAVFGLGFDLPGFYRFAKAEPVLGPLADRLYGFRPTLAPTALEMLVSAITAQQVNLAFAFVLRARLVRRFGTSVRVGDDTVWAFPEAAVLARARLAAFRALKFSGAKALAVRGVAQALATGDLDALALAGATSTAVIARLTALRGLGRWSAEWFLARRLGRGDVCPAGDLGVRRAFEHFYGRGRALTERAIRRRAARWGGWQNLAIHYLLAGMRLQARRSGGTT